MSESAASTTASGRGGAINWEGSESPRDRVFLQFYNLHLAALKHRLPLTPPLSIFLLLLESLQLLSFGLFPDTLWLQASAFQYVQQALSFFLTLQPHLSLPSYAIGWKLFWVCAAYVFGTLLLFLWLIAHQVVGSRLTLYPLRTLWILLWLWPLLCVPVVWHAAAVLACSSGRLQNFGEVVPCWGADNVVQAVGALVVLLASLLLSVQWIYFSHSFHYSSREWLARVHGRHSVFYMLCKLLLPLFTAFLGFSFPVARLSVSILLLLMLTWSVVLHQPYLFGTINHCYAAAAALAACCSACGLAAAAISSSSVAVIITFFVVAPLLAVGCALFSWRRLRRLVRLVNLLDAEGGFPEVMFSRVFEVEISLRFLRSIDPEQLHMCDADDSDDPIASDVWAAAQLAQKGKSEFPRSPAVAMLQATYLVDYRGQYHMAALQLSKMSSYMHSPLFLSDFEQFFRSKQISASTHGLDSQNHQLMRGLRKAQARAVVCTARIQTFWKALETENVDLNSLPDLVTAIDGAEAVARRSFEQLQHEYPNNGRVLRYFARFQQGVAYDFDAADLLMAAAADLERENSSKPRSRRLRKQRKVAPVIQLPTNSGSSAGSDAEMLPSPTDPDRSGSKARFLTPETDSEFPDSRLSYRSSVSERVNDDTLMPSMGSRADDEGSQVSAAQGHAFSQGLSAADRNRLRGYRQLLEQGRSKPVLLLRLAVNGASTTLLLLLLVMISSLLIGMSSLLDTLIIMTDLATIQRQGTSMWGYASEMIIAGTVAQRSLYVSQGWLGAPPNVSKMPFSESTARLGLAAELAHFDSLRKRVFELPAASDAIYEEWNQPDVEYVLPVVQDGSPVQLLNLEGSLWELTERVSKSSLDILSLPFHQVTATGLNKAAPILLLRRMGAEDTLTHHFFHILRAYRDHLQTVLNLPFFVQVVLGPLEVLVAFLLGVCVFRPTLTAINTSRLKTMRLFLTIPKHAVKTIINSFSMSSKSKSTDTATSASDDEDSGVPTAFIPGVTVSSKSGVGMGMMRKFTFTYVLALLVVSFFVVGLTTLSLMWQNAVSIRLYDASYSNSRQYLVRNIRFRATEMVIMDNQTWFGSGGRARISELMLADAAELARLHKALQVGNAELHLFEKDYPSSHPQTILLNQPRCAGVSPPCLSLTGLISHYIDGARQISAFPMVAWDDPLYLDLLETEEQLTDLITRSTAIYQDDVSQNIVRLMSFLYVAVFVSVAMLALVHFRIFLYLVYRLREENRRTIKMLLMIPLDVIDTVPAIQEFLASGAMEEEKVGRELHNAKEQIHSILEISLDAIILINHLDQIIVFNPAAEKIFGWESHEIMGGSLSNLITENFAEAHHQKVLAYQRQNRSTSRIIGRVLPGVARRKDGSVFPVEIIVSTPENEAGDLFFVGFIRDVTEEQLREQQALEDQQRSEALLLNILPAVIAAQLKDKQLRHDTTPIATYHPEVSIFFSDIVGFTRFSSDRSPSEIVDMLDQIVRSFDNMAEQFSIEKIKTIGDAYMCAAGLPLVSSIPPSADTPDAEPVFEVTRDPHHAENIIEFALGCLAAVDNYSQTHGVDLSVRIGINTGSVVAGVIGTKKMCFDLWGDSVNIASRMESNGVPGSVQLSSFTYAHVKDLVSKFLFVMRGDIEIKGKGLMPAYLVRKAISKDLGSNLLVDQIIPTMRRRLTHLSDQQQLLAMSGILSPRSPSFSRGSTRLLENTSSQNPSTRDVAAMNREIRPSRAGTPRRATP